MTTTTATLAFDFSFNSSGIVAKITIVDPVDATALAAKISALATSQLVETTRGLATRFEEGADAAFSACLEEPELRLPAAAFVALCESL